MFINSINSSPEAVAERMQEGRIEQRIQVFGGLPFDP